VGVDYIIDDSTDRIDVDLVHGFLSAETPWAADIPRETFLRSLRTSLCLGSYAPDGGQVGFLRIVTDQATFAWVCDVFVLPGHRGRGVADALVKAALEHPQVAGVRRVLLVTTEAHGLYARSGFSDVSAGRFMEISRAPGRLRASTSGFGEGTRPRTRG
jgi:GNAT superfamily N-acetyltransferase